MAFVDRRSGVYLTLDSTPRVVRPLARKPICKWVYNVGEATQTSQSKKVTLRKFKQVDQDNPFAAALKGAVDPLWDYLDTKSKFNKDGNRVDFPSRVALLIPVWSYPDNDVKIIKQGSQLYEEMEKFDDAGQNIMSCDWTVWKAGAGFQTEYKSSRHDSTVFNAPDPTALLAKGEALLKQALSDLFVWKTQEAFINYIKGQAGEEAQASQFGANQAQLPGAPAQPPANQPFVPGAAPAPLGTFAAPPPTGLPPSIGTPAAASPFAPAAPAAPFVPPASPFAPVPGLPAAAPTLPNANPFAPAAAPAAPAVQPSPFAPVVVQTTYTPTGTTTPVGQVVQPAPLQQVNPFAPTGAAVSAPVSQAAQPATLAISNPFAPASGVPASGPFAPAPAQPNEVAPAAVSAQQFFPPPVAPQAPPAAPTAPATAFVAGQDPSTIVVGFGKYSGKTLGYIVAEGNLKYLPYLKSQVKELAGPIDQLMASLQTQQAQAPAPAATATVTAGTPAQATQAVGMEVQPGLVRECTGLIQQIKAFQGAGMIENLMPFLKNILGGDTNFGNATVDKLTVLKSSLQQKISAAA